MSILIVEDNPVNARLLALMLKAQGYQTVVAGNGKEALATLSDMPDLQLIITDYMMPEMDGFEFIEKARALLSPNRIPMLVTSAHGDLATIQRVQGLACDGFLVKPIDRQELIKRVELLMKSQPVVLLSAQKTMERLDIKLAEYHELAHAFAAQLTAALPIVVLEQGDSDEPISENLGRLLKELAESASMLGADKFLLLFSTCVGLTLPGRSQCSALLRVLQELEMTLQAYIQSQASVAAKG